MSGAAPTSRPRLAALLAAPALALSGAALAEPVHGRLEVQEAGEFSREHSLDAALGAQNRNDLAADLRLKWEPTWDRWGFQVHYKAQVEAGEDVRLARLAGDLIPEPPATLFDLQGEFLDRERIVGRHAIDRLALTYTTPRTVVRVGRQALTWGAGLVFRPMDLFNPFSPGATDTEYKPGADMIYVQRLFADGADLQAIVVPRRPRPGAGPSGDASSFALHLHTTILGHETTWLAARDHGDWVGALGVNGAVGGATWNVEVVPTVSRGGRTRVSALANISTAVTFAGRNATVFAEYFHNGFGAPGDPFDVASLPPPLKDRLGRGQLFSLRRNYLAAGLTLEVSPLVTASPTIITGLDDGSVYLLAAAAWSLGDDLTLIAGAQAPLGPSGTEFGGVPLAPGSSLTAAPSARLYLQLRRYF